MQLSEDSIHWHAVVVAVITIFHGVRGFWVFYVSDIIDDLAEHMDRTDNRVRTETRHVTVVDRKDRTCCKFCSFTL
jgi:chloramphenicol O-acetyltransferase